MNHEIKPGTKWAKKSNRSHVATVLRFDPCDYVGGEGYLRFSAPWSQTGELGKAESAFRAHYDPLPPNPELSALP